MFVKELQLHLCKSASYTAFDSINLLAIIIDARPTNCKGRALGLRLRNREVKEKTRWRVALESFSLSHTKSIYSARVEGMTIIELRRKREDFRRTIS